MKKSLIALAVLAASGAAMAQSSVTLFGIVDTGVGYVKNSGGADNYGLANSGLATSRLGFRGVEDLGGGLKAGFWLEGGLTPDDGTAGGFNFKRRSTISLMGNFGEVRLGRELVAGYKTSNYDLFGQVGMGQFLGWNNSLYGTAGDADGVRANNLIGYYTPNIGGFNAALQYGFGESAASNQNNRYIGANVGYDNGPLSVTLAADQNNFAFGAAPVVSLDRTQVSLGASYDFGMAKLAGLVQRVEFEPAAGGTKVRVNNWSLGVSAPVGPGTVKAQYASYDEKNSSDDAQQISLGYQYDLSKRTAVYTTVAFLKNKNNSNVALGGAGLGLAADAGKNQTGFQVGVRHAF
ncbi:MAG: porin [Simplicispira sp.]|nr:porin [Simplicispira sp.]